MPDRRGYYLKPGVRASAPGSLFSVIVTPAVSQGGATERDQWYSWASADVSYCRWRSGRWGAVSSFAAATPTALASWMQQRAHPHLRNYVVTPSASETLAMSQFWTSIEGSRVTRAKQHVGQVRHKPTKRAKGTVEVRRIVLSPRVGIFDYARDGLRWLWLSARQYFDAPESDLARTFGFQWPDTGHYKTVESKITRTGNERSRLWLTCFSELSTWWRKHAKAPFGLTGSSLSLGILRTHIRPRTLCTHTDPDAHTLEREACYGGRASVWYYGDVGTPSRKATRIAPAPPKSPYGRIPGPLTLVDVRSMYPWLLRECQYPLKITSYRENASPSDPQAYAKSFGVIARVTIETEVPEYPCRVGDRILYPVGRFTTTLTGPELLRLRGDGRVAKCHAMTVYMLGRPFREAAGALIEMREDARDGGRPAWELFAKLLGNGLGGKLAQRKGQWIERPHVVPPVQWGEWYDISASGKARHKYRAMAGLVWEYDPDKTGQGPYTACFAYLTAYGRLHMRRLRDECPANSVVSMDTDGLWVLPRALDAMRRTKSGWGDRAGHIRVASRATAARFFGPRHYYADGRWTLAGFTLPHITQHGRGISDTYAVTPVSGPAGRPPCGVAVRGRDSVLSVESHGVTISPDGWATPKRRRG